MAKFKEGSKFESQRQTWETPDALFNYLNAEFGFTLDVAATEENSKCPNHIDPSQDAIRAEWTGVCWCNPPYGGRGHRLKDWVNKCFWESRKGKCTVVMLIPCRTNTVWWHDYVMEAKEVRFIKGRPKFGDCKHGLPQPLAVVVFQGWGNETKYSSLDIKGIRTEK